MFTSLQTLRAKVATCAWCGVLAALPLHSAFAQAMNDPFRGSLFAGVAANYNSVHGISCLDGCPQFNGGIGGGPFFGAEVLWRYQPETGAALRLKYVGNPFATSARTANEPTLDINGKPTTLVREYSLSMNIPIVAADLLAWHTVGRYKVFGGLESGFLIGPSWESSATIISPATTTYGNNRRDTLFFPRRTIEQARTFQMGITAGLEYEVPIASHWSFVPELNAVLPLTTIQTTADWRDMRVTLAASIRYGVDIHATVAEPVPATPPPSPPAPKEIVHVVPPAVVLPEPAPVAPPLPVARLEIHAIDRDGNRLHTSGINVDIQFVTEAFPLLPFIFFDDHASEIPSRYSLPTRSQGFSVDVVDPNPVDAYTSILAIIGSRMQSHPNANLIVHGYADATWEEADCNLARARAAAIRAYLTDAWNIDSSRVVIKSNRTGCSPGVATVSKTEEGFEENRRVEIESDDPAILEPVERRRFTEPVLSTMPALEFVADAGGGAPVQHWKLITDQEGRILFGDSGASAPRHLRRTIDAVTASALRSATMSSTLNIVDSLGRVVTARATISVVKDTLDTEIERLSLTLFATAQDQLSKEQSGTIRRFMKGFDPNDSITIVGYTDQIGDTALNQSLAQRRADNVKSLIHSIVPEAKHVHSVGYAFKQFSPGIHSYSTPEERFLSRTVQIEMRKKRATQN